MSKHTVSEWPRYLYRPNGEHQIFRSPDDAPSGWITLDEYNVLKERTASPKPAARPDPAKPEAAVLDVLAGASTIPAPELTPSEPPSLHANIPPTPDPEAETVTIPPVETTARVEPSPIPESDRPPPFQPHPLDHDGDGHKGGSLKDPVDIPGDWRSLHHLKRIALAAKIAGEKPASVADADEIISAEVKRRS